VDSPLGPDAFHEYETLLLQDYEELLKKCESKVTGLHQHHKKRELTGVHNEKLAYEDDGWSRPAATKDYDANVVAGSVGRYFCDDDSVSFTEAGDGSGKLLISVHHFPMIMCPVSPRVFVFPSEGAVSEACLSNAHKDFFSPGLPSISGLPSDGEDVPPGATLTANFLYYLAAKVPLCHGICISFIFDLTANSFIVVLFYYQAIFLL